MIAVLALLLSAIVVRSVPPIQEPPPSVAEFTASDPAGKRRTLNDIASTGSRLPIEQVIALVRAAIGDPSADVRVSAMAAVAGRAMASRWAGTAGPRVGPDPGNSVRPEPPTIPLEWKDDQRKLRDALSEGLLGLLRGDSDSRVRYYTLMALGNLERPVRAEDPIRDEFVAVLIERYRRDADDRIRAEVVKALRLSPNDSPAIRAVLGDALVDPAESVRREATSVVTAQGRGARARLSFDDVRPTILASTRHPDVAVRVAAVRTLMLFGAAAAADLSRLRELVDADPDPQVRSSAALAIDAIQRDLRLKRQ